MSESKEATKQGADAPNSAAHHATISHFANQTPKTPTTGSDNVSHPQTASGQVMSKETVVQFRADMAANSKAAQPREYFAEQNAKRAAKKAKQKKQTKIAVLTLAALLIVGVAVGTTLLVLHFLGQDDVEQETGERNPDMAETTFLRVKANELYNEQGNDINAVVDFFAGETEAALSSDDIQRLITVYLAEIETYLAISRPELAVQVIERIDLDILDSDQLIGLCGMAASAYINLGDDEKALFYENLATENGAVVITDGMG